MKTSLACHTANFILRNTSIVAGIFRYNVEDYQGRNVVINDNLDPGRWLYWRFVEKPLNCG